MSNAAVLVYRGRADVALPAGTQDLTTRDVLPARLWPRLEEASSLVILDAWSFPYEALRAADWDVPLVVALPADIPSDALLESLHGDLLTHLGPLDRVVTADDLLWAALRERYHLDDDQRLPLAADLTVAAASAVRAIEGGAIPGRRAKAAHRARDRVLRRQLKAALAAQPTSRPFSMCELAERSSWRQRVLALPGAEHVVVPPARVVSLEPQRFDVTLGESLLAGRTPHDRRALLAQMFRVTRPGGRIFLIEDVVPAAGDQHVDLSTSALVDDVVTATQRRVVIEHAEALRYPRENLYRTLVLVVSTLALPESL